MSIWHFQKVLFIIALVPYSFDLLTFLTFLYIEIMQNISTYCDAKYKQEKLHHDPSVIKFNLQTY